LIPLDLAALFGCRLFTDGFGRDVYKDAGSRQYVLGHSGERVYDQWLPLADGPEFTTALLLSRAIFPTFSPDGRYLAAVRGGAEGLRIWEVATGKEVLCLRPPPFRGYSPSMAPLAFSLDGKAIALGCSDQAVRVWEVATGKELHHLGGRPIPVATSPSRRTAAPFSPAPTAARSAAGT
jgi:WD40 repeat protein